MVVTASLARGAVRAAAGKHSESATEAFSKLQKTGLAVPETMRGFGAWFRKHKAMLEKDALLIVFGTTGRRRGGFCAYCPDFEELDSGWRLGIRNLHIQFSPGNIEGIDFDDLPVQISGHALERMFQRINTIQWPVIRECLAGATLFLSALAQSFVFEGTKQCAIPAERGMLVGQLEDGVLMLRTFLSDSELSQKWQVLYDDLRSFAERESKVLAAAALVPNEELGARFRCLLASRQCEWLKQPYVPGDDPYEEAWRLRA